MKKFERVLLYFLSKKWLSRTEIMKYLYLYEHIHCKHTGKPGTELEFVRWNYGKTGFSQHLNRVPTYIPKSMVIVKVMRLSL